MRFVVFFFSFICLLFFFASSFVSFWFCILLPFFSPLSLMPSCWLSDTSSWYGSYSNELTWYADKFVHNIFFCATQAQALGSHSLMRHNPFALFHRKMVDFQLCFPLRFHYHGRFVFQTTFNIYIIHTHKNEHTYHSYVSSVNQASWKHSTHEMKTFVICCLHHRVDT